MNKFKYGDRVHIKPLNLDGKVLGWTLKIINGVECTCKYGVETLINGVPHIAGDVGEDDLELITYNECSCDCCDRCGHDVCEDSDYNEEEYEDNFENELGDDEIEDYKYNKSCESLDNDKKFNLGDLYDSDEDEKEMIEEIAYDRYIQYESRKLAWEKYKVPMGWKE